MKVLIVSNPGARRNASHIAAGGIASRLLTAGFEVEIKAPPGQTEAMKLISRSRASVVVAVGGDGTASMAARALAALEPGWANKGRKATSKPPVLAVYPAGTVNDFATSAGIPSNLDGFCAAIARQTALDKPPTRRKKETPVSKTVKAGTGVPAGGTTGSGETGFATGDPPRDPWRIDMGLLTPATGSLDANGPMTNAPRAFLNALSVGGFVDSAFTVPQAAKSRLGSLAYYLEAARKISTEPLRPVRMKWRSAESSGDEEIMLALVTNGPSAGGFKSLAPNSAYDDGLLDVMMIRICDVLDLVALFFIILSKSHLDDYRVIHFRTSRIELIPPEPMVCTVDGEMGPPIPGVIESAPGVVRMIDFRKP